MSAFGLSQAARRFAAHPRFSSSSSFRYSSSQMDRPILRTKRASLQR